MNNLGEGDSRHSTIPFLSRRDVQINLLFNEM